MQLVAGWSTLLPLGSRFSAIGLSRGQATFVCYASVKDAERSRTEAELKMAEHEFLLWSNSGVLRAYSAFQKLRKMPHSHTERAAVEKVVKAIRADSGQG